ncbi:hypothetical protein BGZ49_002215 [Haplosporangium sp. Z 27]|nr:hypothetical protein BGZ49_002215 [Haplosporangium sp. Z 27]
MKRSFHHFHSSLKPDAVVFLGDLNDGGRVSYGDVFEKNKERFFEKIFATKSTAWNQEPVVMDMANDNTAPSYSVEEVEHNGSDQKDINITGHYNQLVDLPSDPNERETIRNSGKSVRLYVAGNHDVGFGDTLIRPVMLRYKQLFGSVNYEIVVGNHSLVVLDTLSLSSNVTDIREESQQFLDNIANEAPSLPRILFTHVPLFRLDSTYCGDARESEKQILDIKGVQFQNMVNKPLSREILRGIQPDVIFSGDDHDWCEVAHSLDGRLTPEVTLRTFSFSQGTLQPSVLMLSLYNPELTTRNEYQMVPGSSGLPVSTGGENYESLARPSNNTTFVYEECMLPNQMSIYMCYASLLSITVSLILILRFRWIMQGRRHLAERSLLVRWKDPKYPTISPQGSTTATAIPMHPYSDAAFSGESLLESSSNSFPGEMGRLKKTAVWPFLSIIYWRMVGWDVWNIARYAVPLYLIMFFLSSI